MVPSRHIIFWESLFLAAKAVCTNVNAAMIRRDLYQAPASGRLAAAIATNCAIRRLIRRGVVRSREATRRITKSPSTPGQEPPLNPWRKRENGRTQTACRDGLKNSNTPVVQGMADRGFVIAADRGTRKIFSPFWRYVGVTPKVRAKRSL
jgi:hypothetical protein